jgi:hypothetical protein
MNLQTKKNVFFKFILSAVLVVLAGCASDDDRSEEIITPPDETEPISIDLNDDGKLNILVLGTSKSISENSSEFASDKVSVELERILSQDTALNLEVNVVSENIYKSKDIDYGLGQAGTVYNLTHFSHSLMQYYYWPEGHTERLENLSGAGTHQWDYVVIAADPYIVSKIPGYYALGVNKIASKVHEGGAKPLLLMVWPKDETNTAAISHYEEFTYRTADNAKVDIDVISAGLAWEALPADKKDNATEHPTPNGAYVTAASIYAQLLNRSASTSDYEYDDAIAEVALTTKTNAEAASHYTGERTFMSPYKSCDIDEAELNYNHTGTSSENGILNGLQWVVAQSDRTLVNGGIPPINFNYGRANTNFEPHKRYNIDPAQFDFSIGFPMQDHGNHGNTSMLYGLDKRFNEANNGTDLGTALYMVSNSELPHARAIPVRTLYAQMKESIPSQSAFSDNWHMHGNLDKAIGAYMYTLLTGECVLGDEPFDESSNEWKTWMSQKIGHETAYIVMDFNGTAPSCN